jgi:hypothetical protein
MNLHFRPQGPASCLDDRRSISHRQLHTSTWLHALLSWLLARRYPAFCFLRSAHHRFLNSDSRFLAAALIRGRPRLLPFLAFLRPL